MAPSKTLDGATLVFKFARIVVASPTLTTISAHALRHPRRVHAQMKASLITPPSPAVSQRLHRLTHVMTCPFFWVNARSQSPSAIYSNRSRCGLRMQVHVDLPHFILFYSRHVSSHGSQVSTCVIMLDVDHGHWDLLAVICSLCSVSLLFLYASLSSSI